MTYPSQAQQAADADAGGTLLGQPRGLFYLFFAEMWERFSYYGLRALLILYLIDQWAMSDEGATTIYGAYTSMAFGAAVIGGLLADRLFGLRRLLVMGGTLILLGHVLLAVQDHMGGHGGLVEQLLLLSLALIVVGTGFFKPAVATQVGALYGQDDPRRETGFYVFYVGINLGAALAPLVCGYLGQTYGWSWGFGVAAVGMAAGLGLIIAGRKSMPDPLAKPSSARKNLLSAAIPFLGVLIAYGLMRMTDIIGYVLAIVLGGGVTAIARFLIRTATPAERRHITVALALILGAIVFWSLTQQAGSSLNLFAARAVDLSVGPITLKSSQTQFFNPGFIIICAPLFALLWQSLAVRGKEPQPPMKFTLGLAQATAGFGALAIGALLTTDGHQVALIWLVLAYLLHTTGELCLATPGLATITRLTPAPIKTLMMGLWLSAISIGNFIGAKIAGATSRATQGGNDLSAYASVFGTVTACAGVATFVMLAFVPKLTRMMQPKT